jgi:hypothetical protein
VLHRWVRAGAVAAMVVALTPIPAPAQQAPAGGSRLGQVAVPSGSIRIASISPWMDKTHSFSVTVQVTNQTELALENASVRISVFGRVLSRGQLRQSLDGGTPTETLGNFTEPLDGVVSPGEQRTLTIERPVAALIGSIARTGVYPIQISVVHSRGEETVSTAIPYFGSPPLNPLNVTWVLPISAPTIRPVDGAYSQEQIDALGIAEVTQQLQAIAARPGANLTLAPDPSLLDTLSDLADGFDLSGPTGRQPVGPDDPDARAAADFLDAFKRGAQAAGEIATVPYAPADLPSLAQHNMRADMLRQVTLGRSVAEQILDRSPSLSVLVPQGLALDPASASALAPHGISGVVIDPATLPQQPIEPFQPQLFGASRPVALEGSLTALLPDPPVTTRMHGPEQGVLLAQSLIAETASSYLELPSLGTERVLVIDSPARIAPTTLAAAIDGLSHAPWVRMRSATDAMQNLPPQGAQLPLPQGLRPDRLFLAAARAARGLLSTLNAITVDPLPESGSFDRTLLASESAEWDGTPSAGVALARTVRAAVSTMLSGIQVGAGRRVTLTSKSGSVPVTVINQNPFPVRLLIRVGSAKVGFPSGSTRTIQVDPPNDTVDFTVQARAAGSFPLDVRLETPDGAHLIARGRVVLRSSAVSAVALLVVGGSAVFLLLAWARRSRRRSRATGRAETAQPPADTA